LSSDEAIKRPFLVWFGLSSGPFDFRAEEIEKNKKIKIKIKK
jgi:hypothetical protein